MDNVENFDTTYNVFKNFGFLMHRFKDEELQFLREEVNQIKDNFTSNSHLACNDNLAGNIEHEYRITSSKQRLSDMLMPYLITYDQQCNYINSLKCLTNNVPLDMNKCWVNFQKKGEFNPLHDHSGVISFVIYLRVPYKIEDEKKNISSRNSNVNVPAHFVFHYTTALGDIFSHEIPVDETYENVMIMFPAKMKHVVYPFYTSDEYRISVSGNFSFKT